MKAIGLYKYLPIEQEDSLLDVEVEKPIPTKQDILVKIKAISINPVDVKVRAPKDKEEKEPRILGWDASGVVEEVGPDCTLFKPGDEVYYSGDLTRPGTYSEYHLVDERIVGLKPKSLNFAQAAALPLTSITAWESLFDRLMIDINNQLENQSRTILIIGGAGGVGSVAIQLAKLAGLQVIATASREKSKQWVKQLGADYIINHHEAFRPQLEAHHIKEVHYILCLNETEQHWENMADVILPQGRICSIVEMDNPIDLTALKNKSVTFAWEFMFTRSMYKTTDMIKQHELLSNLSQLIDEGKVKTTLTETLRPLNAETLRKAHQMVETGSMIGKVVVENE
ncbi:NADPH:quinone reductase [Pullulanibacillus camelliae]|uniref:Zinc-type alcohol dehydrogenase-like protein n=1 Tax=Pullulanibacillus camelliae TaxID=1707096 RepID=A0A8J2YC32_9BACL|nr:zinc-binding alcohol dehydrogenase family protein [Pullulanibacillus camelliae]GGE35466.1 NADPH:quinone reductase [Pullulanibacillus camelliae]